MFRTHRQNVASIPLYKLKTPSVLIACLITSVGPAKLVLLSCSRILTSSNGVTTTDSVAPARNPVAVARNCVFLREPFEVRTPDQYPLAPTVRVSYVQYDWESGAGLHLMARLGASSIRGGMIPLYSRDTLKLARPRVDHTPGYR
jgi:hypothetical protein